MFDTRDLFSDPHLAARDFIKHVQDEDGEQQATLLGWPARMSASSVPITLAPTLGEHTREVLGAELGLDEAALDALAAAHIIA
ncbi:MAG: CoA transferase [Proteobacteria bacterium]|nr:CoA transferase [Pseudomonadota bacterium]